MRTIYGPLYILCPYERGIQEFLGKYNGFLLPGKSLFEFEDSFYNLGELTNVYFTHQ